MRSAPGPTLSGIAGKSGSYGRSFNLFIILGLYLLLGCVMDSLAMIMGLDFFGMSETDKSIWFGILALMVVEIGLIHPPLGMNLFIVQRTAGDVPYGETAKGIVPFLCSDLLRIALLVAFPGLSLWLLAF